MNSFLLDGVDNNAYGTSNQGFSNEVIQPNPDALAEFKVETNNYSGEYGRATGAVVNATIKSGTNQIHGELWEFVRNTVFNAGGFFRPANNNKPRFNWNQFGGALGGPILKNKMFLFGDYEGFRRVAHSVQTATIPNLAFRQGNFSSVSGLNIRNPLTGASYGSTLPVAAMSQFSQVVLGQLPTPTQSGLNNNYVSNLGETIDSDKGDIRWDSYFNNHFSAFVRYSQGNIRIFSPPAIPGPSGGNSNGNVYIRNKQGVPGVTWTINPTSVLEARVGIDYTEGGKNPIGLGLPTDQYGLPNLPTNPAFAGGPVLAELLGGPFAIGKAEQQSPVSISAGHRSEGKLHQNPLPSQLEARVRIPEDKHGSSGLSSEVWSRQLSGILQQRQQHRKQQSFVSATAAYSLADFMLGLRSRYEQNNYAVAYLRQRMYFGYLQDDYRVNDKLTLNLGVRYEFATPQWERDNKLSNFDPVTGTLISASSGSLYDRALECIPITTTGRRGSASRTR